LRRIRANRDGQGLPIRSEIYPDESYVNKNHSNDFIWYSGEDGPWVQKPFVQGERLIIINAISLNGWVNGAKRVFQARRKTDDYRGQIADFYNVVYQQSDIRDSELAIEPSTEGLQPETSYYWTVEAVDFFWARTMAREVRVFRTESE